MRRRDAKPVDPHQVLASYNTRTREQAREQREPGALLTPAALRLRNHAKSQLHEAIFRKRLIRPEACSACGNTERRIEAHQPDFSKPLEVIWLCHPCNKPRRTERVAAYKAAIAAGGGTVAGLWIAGYNGRPDGSAAGTTKTLQAYSHKRGARGGDAATRLAVRSQKPDPNANDATQQFIDADVCRYLAGLPSRLGVALAKKGGPRLHAQAEV